VTEQEGIKVEIENNRMKGRVSEKEKKGRKKEG
jgi:hypothetical protein